MNSLFGRFGMTPPVVKNLVIINVLAFLGMIAARSAFQLDLNWVLGLHFFESPAFQPFQIVTHMFMHGSIGHLFFNMFALWMFGQALEQVWGGKRFFIFYFVSGFGAVLVHTVATFVQFKIHSSGLSPEMVNKVITDGAELLRTQRNYVDDTLGSLNIIVNTTTVGASGAIFGIIAGFGLLFPNARLMLLFPPIPIRGKYIALVALAMGVLFDRQGNIAHFAHLGGAVFGYLLVKFWQKDRNKFY